MCKSVGSICKNHACTQSCLPTSCMKWFNGHLPCGNGLIFKVCLEEKAKESAKLALKKREGSVATFGFKKRERKRFHVTCFMGAQCLDFCYLEACGLSPLSHGLRPYGLCLLHVHAMHAFSCF